MVYVVEWGVAIMSVHKTKKGALAKAKMLKKAKPSAAKMVKITKRDLEA